MPLYGCIIALHYKGEPLLGVIDHQGVGLRCHAGFGLGAFANGERLRIEDCSSDEAGAAARIGLPSRASFLKPRDSSTVFAAIVDAYPNFRAYHTCYSHTLTLLGGLDAAMEWGTPLWDVAATRILVEEAGGHYRSAGEIDIPGERRYYSGTAGILTSLYDGDPDRLAFLLDQTATLGRLSLFSSTEVDFDVPGEGRYYSAVFGKPAVVERLGAIIDASVDAAVDAADQPSS